MVHRFSRAAALVVMAWAAGSAAATLVELIPDKDNTLYEHSAGAVSNGAGSYFFAGVNLGGSIRRGLLAFDVVRHVPAGATINAVTLTLHMSRTNISAGPQTLSLHRVLADWGESISDAGGEEGQGAPASMGDATWLHTFYNSSFWSTAGGDFVTTPSAATTVDGVGFYHWQGAGMVADVQAWLDDPDTDFGWIVLGNETATRTTKRFDSKQHTNGDFWPKLTIEFNAVPEPATLLLLAGGAWAVRRRD